MHIIRPMYTHQVSSTDEKLKDITSAVLEELRKSCTDCAITNDIVDKEFFSLCESPKYVMYRARVEGTSQIDSGSLVSLIAKWVSGGPRIIVTKVQMELDSECSVAILGECGQITTEPATGVTETPTVTVDTVAVDTQDTSASQTGNAALVGGTTAVAIILIIAITVIVVAIVALVIVRHRQKDFSLWRAEQ